MFFFLSLSLSFFLSLSLFLTHTQMLRNGHFIHPINRSPQNFNEVERISLEIIKEAPHVPDPYLLMGLSCMEQEDFAKALKYKVRACTL